MKVMSILEALQYIHEHGDQSGFSEWAGCALWNTVSRMLYSESLLPGMTWTEEELNQLINDSYE